MLLLLSPAKKLNYSDPVTDVSHSQPQLLPETQMLIDRLKTLSPEEISSLMGLSEQLGFLNYQRFQDWHIPFNQDNARQAIFAFKGDVYQGLSAETFNKKDLVWAQDHIRIISGLYGLLRPLDLIQPYRLEMGTKFENLRGKDLYKFWGSTITDACNKQIKALSEKKLPPFLINLASNEYFKAITPKNLETSVITPIFKEKRGKEYRVISFFAKRARGQIAAFATKNKLSNINDLKEFRDDDYRFKSELSSADKWVFTRG